MCPRVWILCALVSILSVSYACTSRKIHLKSDNDSGTTDGEIKMSGCDNASCSLRIENYVNVEVTCRNVPELKIASAKKLKEETLIEIKIRQNQTSNQTNNNTITYNNQTGHLTFILRNVKSPGEYGFAMSMNRNNIKADECTVRLDVICTDGMTSTATYNSPVWPGIVTVVLLIVMLCVGAYFVRKRMRNRQTRQYHEAEPCISHPVQENAVCPNCQSSLSVDVQISSGLNEKQPVFYSQANKLDKTTFQGLKN